MKLIRLETYYDHDDAIQDRHTTMYINTNIINRIIFVDVKIPRIKRNIALIKVYIGQNNEYFYISDNEDNRIKLKIKGAQ